jgi:spore protease
MNCIKISFLGKIGTVDFCIFYKNGGFGMEQRTDLALEIRESFPEDDVELAGVVVLEDRVEDTQIKISRVEIKDERGAKQMGKPKGKYITVEAKEYLDSSRQEEDILIRELAKLIGQLCKDFGKEKSILIAGLGNREVTADSIGPRVVEKLFVTRHLIREFGEQFQKKHGFGMVSAIAPGVMAQTGMETLEVLSGIAEKTEADLLILIDALAARSTERLNTTIQLTDTGICPGAGVGNHRQALNEESLGVKVLAIGVPTVVDAATIVRDTMNSVLLKQGFSEGEREEFHREVGEEATKNLFVTPKNIDEAIDRMSNILADALNMCFVQG